MKKKMQVTPIECAICLFEIEHGTSVTKGSGFCNCSHLFCQKCVVEYVKNKKMNEITCPICREPCKEEKPTRCEKWLNIN